MQIRIKDEPTQKQESIVVLSLERSGSEVSLMARVDGGHAWYLITFNAVGEALLAAGGFRLAGLNKIDA